MAAMWGINPLDPWGTPSLLPTPHPGYIPLLATVPMSTQHSPEVHSPWLHRQPRHQALHTPNPPIPTPTPLPAGSVQPHGCNPPAGGPIPAGHAVRTAAWRA